jgi:hypothetical protein
LIVERSASENSRGHRAQTHLLDQLASQRAARFFAMINTAAGQRPRAKVMPTRGDPGEQHLVSASDQGSHRQS